MALIVEFCDHNIPFSKGRTLVICAKKSLINNENWKNVYTKGYVLSLIIGGGGQVPHSEVLGVGPVAPQAPLFLLHCFVIENHRKAWVRGYKESRSLLLIIE